MFVRNTEKLASKTEIYLIYEIEIYDKNLKFCYKFH